LGHRIARPVMKSAALSKAGLVACTLLASCTVFSSALVAAAADGQEADACRIIRSDGGTRYLERCGNRFRYIGASFDDSRGRLEPFGRHAQFYFRCMINPIVRDGMRVCASEPRIFGWFIDRTWWARSSRGEDAVFAALRQMPSGAISWGFPGGKPPQSQCGTLDVQVAGVPGRGVCDLHGTGSRIVIVGGDNDFAFVLTFTQEGSDYTTLLERVRAMLPKFQIEKLLDEAVLRKGFE
jgi:hypothetical protein